MKQDSREVRTLHTAEARHQPRATETTFIVPRRNEFLASAAVARPADTAPAVKKPELAPVPAVAHDMTPPPPFKFIMGLQNEAAWKDPKDPRNKEIRSDTAGSFLQRIGSAATDFAGQFLFWSLAPAIYGIRKATDTKNIVGKILYGGIGLAATGAMLVWHIPYVTFGVTALGIGAATQRVVTGRSSFPRARDLWKKTTELFRTRK